MFTVKLVVCYRNARGIRIKIFRCQCFGRVCSLCVHVGARAQGVHRVFTMNKKGGEGDRHDITSNTRKIENYN